MTWAEIDLFSSVFKLRLFVLVWLLYRKLNSLVSYAFVRLSQWLSMAFKMYHLTFLFRHLNQLKFDSSSIRPLIG